MDEADFNKKLTTLIRAVAELPLYQQQQLLPLIEETQQRHQQIRTMSEKISESLTDLRTTIQYLLFDLEATRRERDILRDKSQQ